MSNQCSKCMFYDSTFDDMHQNDYVVIGEEEREHYCAAFTEGIPKEIWEDRVKHDKPYKGDNGIQFVPAGGIDE